MEETALPKKVMSARVGPPLVSEAILTEEETVPTVPLAT